MATLRARMTVSDVKPGEHIGMVYEQADERLSILVAFLIAGLKQGEKAFLVTAAASESLSGPLAEAGVDLAKLAAGLVQLVLPDWRSEADVAAWLHQESDRALAEGFTGLRLVVETARLENGESSFPLSARELENGLEAGLTGAACEVLCLYRRKTVEATDLLWDLLQSHSAMVTVTPAFEEPGHPSAAEIQETLESWMRTFFENRLEPMLLVDPVSGLIVDGNPAACDFYGYKRESLVNLPLDDIDRSPVAMRLAWLERMGRGEGGEFESQHQLSNGQLCKVELQGGPLRYREQPLVYFIVYDQRERRWAEIALKESQERFSQLVENVPVGIVFVTSEGRFQFMNGTAERIMGIKAELAAHLSYEDFLTRVTTLEGAPWPMESLALHRAVLERRPVQDVRCVIRRLDESRIFVSVDFTPLENTKGEIQGLVISLKDISAQVEAESAQRQLMLGARKEVKKWGAVFETLIDGVMLINLKNVIESVNPAAVRLMGSDPTGLNVHTAFKEVSFCCLDGRPLRRIEELPFSRALRGERVIGGQYTLTNARGRTLSLLASATPIYEEGEISGAVMVWHDVTEREEFYQQIELERHLNLRLNGEVRHEMDRLHIIFDALAELVVSIDGVGDIVSANPAAVRFFGGDPVGVDRAVLGQRLNVRQLDGKPVPFAAFPSSRALKGEVVSREEFIVRGPEGEDLLVEISAAPIQESGQVIGAVSIWHDVTDRALLQQKTEQEKRQAEELAAEAQSEVERLNEIFGAMSDVVMVTDESGTTIAANPAARRFFGEDPTRLTREELGARARVRYLDGRPLPADQFPASRCLKSGKAVLNERYAIDNAEGQALILSFSAVPIKKGKRVTGVVAVWRDVTEHERLLQEVERNRVLLQALIDTIPAGVVAVDGEGKLLVCNPASEEILGCPLYKPAREYMGDYTLHQLDGTLIPGEETPFSRTLLRNEILKDEAVLVRRQDGRELIVNVSTRPLYDGENQLQGAVAVIQDISERKQAEAERERLLMKVELERARLGAVLATLPLPIIFVDSEAIVQIVNPVAEEFWHHALVGKCWHDVMKEWDYFHSETGMKIPPKERPLARALQGEPVLDFEIVSDRPDGSRVPTLLHAAPVKLQGRVVGALQVAQDLTRLKEADRIKDQFLAMVSHDLRSPLASIKGWATTAQEDPTDLELVQKALALILKGVQTQQRLIDDLLDSAALAVGILRVTPELQDLRPIVEQVAMGVQMAGAERGITLHWHLPEEPLPAVVDAMRLQQILGNLIANAYKFTPKGGQVEIDLERDAAGVVLRVRDSGYGISAEQLPHIFERFYMESEKRVPGTRSLGLGLAIVKALVELHGGHVSAASEGAQKGSTFTVWLPLEGG